MCVLRCDFMIDVPSNSVKLVEYNTVASSFGCLSEKVKGVQSYIKDKYEDIINYNYEPLNPDNFNGSDVETIRFANEAQGSFVNNLVINFKRTIDEYKRTLLEKFQIDSKDPWVLFVIEEKERNVIDQKLIEFEL